ncbi:MAG: hypothetical protein ACFB0B_01370 [Thermonemataceae bacterium]
MKDNSPLFVYTDTIKLAQFTKSSITGKDFTLLLSLVFAYLLEIVYIHNFIRSPILCIIMNEEINPETLSLYMQLVGKMYAKTLSYDLEFTNLERYYLILWAIDEGYEQLTQQNLSDLFKVDKAAMVRIVADLT